MTQEELQARQAEIRARLQEIDHEHAGQALPDGLRDEWDRLNQEFDDNAALDAEMTTRRERVAQLSGTESNRESGSHLYVQPAGRVRGDDIYDLSTVRMSMTSPEVAARELRDRALQAIDRADFAHPRADRDEGRARVERLLARDNEHGELARRLLLTGSPVYMRAFSKHLGGLPLSPEEQRALSLTTTQGGFAVPFTLDPTIILTSDGALNPVRAIARTETIVTTSWQGITSAGITASYSAEAAEVGDNAPTIAQPQVDVERATAFVPFSFEIGMDWAGMQSEMARLLSDAKDVLEADKFINGAGSGSNEPEGVVAGLGAGSEVDTATALTFAAGDVYALDDALGPRYRPRARFLANKTIVNEIRQFDTQGGAQLWERIGAGMPAELLGYPIHEASEMASTSGVADSKILLLGDFNHYLIVDRVGMSIELVPHLFATANNRPSGQRGLLAFWRNSAEVLVDNAFRVLNVLTT